MATFDSYRSTRPLAQGSIFANLLGSVTDWNERRVTAKLLHGLSDRELDDIGLRRADIDRVAWSRR
jgi:uncharacterized protein YjiS (DUF1127 family)